MKLNMFTIRSTEAVEGEETPVNNPLQNPMITGAIGSAVGFVLMGILAIIVYQFFLKKTLPVGIKSLLETSEKPENTQVKSFLAATDKDFTVAVGNSGSKLTVEARAKAVTPANNHNKTNNK